MILPLKAFQSFQMRSVLRMLLLLTLLLPPCGSLAQEVLQDGVYTCQKGDPNGTGKWYMGREIAQVMGYQGMAWLERPDREAEEKTSLLLENMEIQPGDTIADIGAGSGYHVFKMARLAPEGLVYAVDIQEEMLAAVRRNKAQQGISNVRTVQGGETSVNLGEDSVDKVLMVDVYHEFSFPKELMESVRKALRRDGKLFLVEYREEDPRVPIKKVHKMSEAQAVKELKAAGFTLQRNIANLPRQHCMVFVKD